MFKANGIPVTDRPHVVIIGGGFGGLAAAQALRRAPVDVTVIDRANHHLFQPLLYQVATAALSPGDIASPIRWILRRQANVRVLLAEARTINVERRVVTSVGPEPSSADTPVETLYDYLILAPGATHAYFGRDEWAPLAPGLKTLDDALEIRRRVLLAFEAAERSVASERSETSRLLTFVIVGGGPTGVELAGAFAEIARRALPRDFRAIHTESARILLAEAGPTILPAFPDDLRRAARAALGALGVDVREGAAVTSIEPGRVVVGSELIEASTVVWAAGVAAAPLLRTLGVPLDRAGRVVVEPDLSVPGHPEIFVIGDGAAFVHQPGAGGRLLAGVAPVAQQQGAWAARSVIASVQGRERRPFRYRNFGNLATIGRGYAIGDLGWLRIKGFAAWLFWLFVHIMKLVGFRNRVAVFIEWGWAYFTQQRSVRLITGLGRPTHPR